MATGDIVWFNAAKRLDYYVGWSGSDDIKVAILDNTTTPQAVDVTPSLSDYNQVGTGGSYTSGGVSIGAWNTLWSESSGTATFDSATDPSWTSNGSNDNDAYWGLLYNDTQAGDLAIAFVDLGGPFDMSTNALGINWNVLGIATIT